MKRILALLLITVISLSLFSGSVNVSADENVKGSNEKIKVSERIDNGGTDDGIELVRAKFEAICPKGVGGYNVGTRIDVIFMYG